MWVYGAEAENSETPLIDKNDKMNAKIEARSTATDNVKSKFFPSLAVLEISSSVLSLFAIGFAIYYATHGNFEKLRIGKLRIWARASQVVCPGACC